jgi:hypothetical protein
MRITYEPTYERLRQHERAILMRKQGKQSPKEAIKTLPAAQIIWALRAHVKALLIDFNRLSLEYRNLKIEDGIKDGEIDALYGVLIKRDAEIAKLKELIFDFRERDDESFEGERCKIPCKICSLLARADSVLDRPSTWGATLDRPYRPYITRVYYHAEHIIGFENWAGQYWPQEPSPGVSELCHRIDALRAYGAARDSASLPAANGLVARVWARRRTPGRPGLRIRS